MSERPRSLSKSEAVGDDVSPLKVVPVRTDPRELLVPGVCPPLVPAERAGPELQPPGGRGAGPALNSAARPAMQPAASPVGTVSMLLTSVCPRLRRSDFASFHFSVEHCGEARIQPAPLKCECQRLRLSCGSRKRPGRFQYQCSLKGWGHVTPVSRDSTPFWGWCACPGVTLFLLLTIRYHKVDPGPKHGPSGHLSL